MSRVDPLRDDAGADEPSGRVERLTGRQRDVLELMARGRSNKEIAGALAISPETVRTHATAVLDRLEVDNRTAAAAAYLGWRARPQRAVELLARPAIAVLPLEVVAGDRAGARLAPAIGRELTTLLSRWCWFPVIAHAATADPRALGATSGEIGRRLGARFLVDGRLQCRGGRGRLDMRVVDADSGHCVWAERFEVAARGWFDVQDDVCRTIVASAYPRLIATVHAGLAGGSAATDLTAWQQAHRALRDQEARDRAANRRAADGFAAALARDPDLVLAHFGRGLTAYDVVLNQWGPAAAAIDQLGRSAERCLALAPDHPEGHFLIGRRCQAQSRHDQALPSLRRAIALNPSFAPAYALLAQALLLTGSDDEGLVRMQQACRLDPRSFVAGLAVAHFTRGEYALARDAIARAIAHNPRYPFAHALAAACAWWCDDRAAAADHAATLRALAADFTPAIFARTFGGEIDAVARMARALEAITAGSAPTTAARRGAATAR